MDNRCKYEEYQTYVKIDGGKFLDKFLVKVVYKKSNGFPRINILACELSCLGKNDEVCSKRKKALDHPYGSFKGLKDARRDSDEKTRENSLKSSLPRMLSSVSFNDKILNASNMGANSQRKPSAIFRLSFKRRSSCDREETVEHCKHSNNLFFFWCQENSTCKGHAFHVCNF